eukprot:6385298-Prymnesium_polylepis.1
MPISGTSMCRVSLIARPSSCARPASVPAEMIAAPLTCAALTKPSMSVSSLFSVSSLSCASRKFWAPPVIEKMTVCARVRGKVR